MEFLLPLLTNPNAFQAHGFGHPGFGFGQQQRCGQQQQPCSSQQAKARGSAAGHAHEQYAGFDPADYGFNLEDFVSTAVGILSSLTDKQQNKTSTSTTTKTKNKKSTANIDGFQLKFDVAQFKPEELTVKIVDNFVVLEGVHEERDDGNGFITQQFTRRIPIPVGIDGDGITCSFTSDGQLVVSAPKLVPVQTPAAAVEENSIPIPIQFSNDIGAGETGNNNGKSE